MTTIRRLWCRAFHSRIRYAGGSTYRCASCGCEFRCPWADQRGTEGRVTWTVDGAKTEQA